eukprot:Nk52_evm109s485 gene=Nk52_evmTU109s485
MYACEGLGKPLPVWRYYPHGQEAKTFGNDSGEEEEKKRQPVGVLLVGDGDLSYSWSLCRNYRRWRDGEGRGGEEGLVLGSTLEDAGQLFAKYPQAAEHARGIEECGQRVVCGVDARRMLDHKAVREFVNQCAERCKKSKLEGRNSRGILIIFNFPHTGGKSFIKQNRLLVKDFLSSAREVIGLCGEGEVHVVLCRGQGGTPLDNPCRHYNDHWQVCDMGTCAGMVLKSVHPFNPRLFDDYKSGGYRGINRSFINEDSKIHIFRKGEQITAAASFEVATGENDGALDFKCDLVDRQKSILELERDQIESVGCRHPLVKVNSWILVTLSRYSTSSGEALEGPVDFEVGDIEWDSFGVHGDLQRIDMGRMASHQQGEVVYNVRTYEINNALCRSCSRQAGQGSAEEDDELLKKLAVPVLHNSLILAKAYPEVEIQSLQEYIKGCFSSLRNEKSRVEWCVSTNIDNERWKRNVLVLNWMNEAEGMDLPLCVIDLFKRDGKEGILSLCFLLNFAAMYIYQPSDITWIRTIDAQVTRAENGLLGASIKEKALFPPLHVHDISFWVMKQSLDNRTGFSEDLFLAFLWFFVGFTSNSVIIHDVKPLGSFPLVGPDAKEFPFKKPPPEDAIEARYYRIAYKCVDKALGKDVCAQIQIEVTRKYLELYFNVQLR